MLLFGRSVNVNWLTGVLSAGMNALQALAIIWIVDRHIGQEALALWSLVTSFHVLLTFSDMGLSNALVARLKALERSAHLTAVLSNAVLTGAIGLGVLAVIQLFFWVYAGTLSFPAEGAWAVSLIYGGAALCLLLSRVFQMALVALDKVYLSHLLHMAYFAVSFAAVLVWPMLGSVGASGSAGLSGLAAILLISAGLLLGGHLVLVRLACPTGDGIGGGTGAGGMRLSGHQIGLEWRANRASGLRFQGAGILGYLLDPLTRIMLERAGGSAALAQFEVVYRVAFGIRQFITRPLVFLAGRQQSKAAGRTESTTEGVIESATESAVPSLRQQLWQQLWQARRIALICLLAYLGLAAVAYPALPALGFSVAASDSYALSYLAIAAASALSVLGMVAHYILTGQGRSDRILWAHVVQFCGALVLYGVLAATEAGMTAYFCGFAVLLAVPTLWYLGYLAGPKSRRAA